MDTQSGLIWKDRSFKKAERARNENLMNGRIGNVAFDHSMQESLEKRFLSKMKENKRFVTDNALRAQANLGIINSLYDNKDSDAGSGIFNTKPVARAAMEIMNRSTNQHLKKTSTSMTPSAK